MKTNTRSVHFPLGQVFITAGAKEVLNPQLALSLLWRHSHGEWGITPEGLKMQNLEALSKALPIQSYFQIQSFVIAILTNEARTVTTLAAHPENEPFDLALIENWITTYNCRTCG